MKPDFTRPGRRPSIVAFTTASKSESRPSTGWRGIYRGHRVRPFEWRVEHLFFLTSSSAIGPVFLIFIFVGRGAVGVLVGRVNSAAVQPIIPAAELNHTSPARLQEYLQLTPAEFATKDQDTLRLFRQLYRELAGHMAESPTTITRSLHLMTVSKALERIADHTKHIAEEAVYLYEAKDIRHQNPL